MRKTIKKIKIDSGDFIARLGEEGWTYIKTVVDVVREPILILDKEFRILAANESFYQTFKVTAKKTEGTVIYKLGNGQWDIPTLRKLLEDILPKHTFFHGFEVTHEFPIIGYKVMILNARQIYFEANSKFAACPPIILLAMEDVTEIMGVAKKMADHTNSIEAKFKEDIEELKNKIGKLEKRQ